MTVSDLRARWYEPERYTTDAPFRELITSRVRSDSRVLDAGAGAGELFQYDFKSCAREIVGVDLDARVVINPQLHHGIVADLTDIPVESGYFDIAFSRYVLEHIQEPRRFLKEICRVLKPGGCFIFLTPNKWHYVIIGSRLTPGSFHKRFNRLRGVSEDDTFPTIYRLNSPRDLRREFSLAGFKEAQLRFLECSPNYLTFARILFMCGVAYERLVNSTDLLESFRVNILGCFLKE